MSHKYNCVWTELESSAPLRDRVESETESVACARFNVGHFINLCHKKLSLEHQLTVTYIIKIN